MSHHKTGWKTAQQTALIATALLIAVGCNARDRSRGKNLYNRIMQKDHAPAPGEMAAKGKETITIECSRASWANVSKGLIVTESGTHQNVFSLRDRTTYRPDAYALDEAQRLVVLLRTEASAGGHPEDQTSCIQQFAEHFQALNEPLLEADKEQRELDVPALNRSGKENEDQEQKLPETVQPPPR